MPLWHARYRSTPAWLCSCGQRQSGSDRACRARSHRPTFTVGALQAVAMGYTRRVKVKFQAGALHQDRGQMFRRWDLSLLARRSSSSSPRMVQPSRFHTSPIADCALARSRLRGRCAQSQKTATRDIENLLLVVGKRRPRHLVASYTVTRSKPHCEQRNRPTKSSTSVVHSRLLPSENG